MFVITTIIAIALFTATMCGNFYVQQVQVKRCYEYARRKALPDREYLEFSGVVIATNQFHGHICQFTDSRTGYPVSLAFDAEDVPYGVDTFQVLSAVVPILCVTPLGWALAAWALRRVGWPVE